MEKLQKEFDGYSNDLEADFFNWEDDFVSENAQLSDVENDFGSKNLIRSLQSTSNKVRSQYSMSPICREERLHHGNIEALTCKEMKFSKCTSSYEDVLQKNHKPMDILSLERTTSNIRKDLYDDDSDEFCNPNKKRKRRKILSANDSVKYYEEKYLAPIEEKSDKEVLKSQSNSMTISSQSSGSQMASVSSQQSCGCKMITLSQEISTSQKMVTSSQEFSASQNITSSQECTSPKRIASSQESLGNQVMNISLKEDFSIKNNACQSSSRTQIVITPRQNGSNCQPILTHEEFISSKLNSIEKLKTTNSKYLAVFNQTILGNKAVSRTERRRLGSFDSPEKNKFTENLANSVSDSFCNKTCKRYNKAERRMIWSIRKKELLMTKRENAVEIREKQLDAREADILKREEILKAKERKYLRYKTNLKKWINQKLTNNSKKVRRKIGVLEDETNAFNKISAFKVFK